MLTEVFNNLHNFFNIADSDPVFINQVSSVQLVTDKKLEALNKALLRLSHLWDRCFGKKIRMYRTEKTVKIVVY